MKTKVLSYYSKILCFFLVLLGFASCSSTFDDENPEMRLEYGTPTAKYKIRGTVKSQDKQKAIKGIKIVAIEIHEGKEYPIANPINSGDDGSFNLEVGSFPQKDVTFNVKFEDANGEFESKIVAAEFKDAKFTGGDGRWYKGETEKDMGSIDLTPTKKD